MAVLVFNYNKNVLFPGIYYFNVLHEVITVPVILVVCFDCADNSAGLVTDATVIKSLPPRDVNLGGKIMNCHVCCCSVDGFLCLRFGWQRETEGEKESKTRRKREREKIVCLSSINTWQQSTYWSTSWFRLSGKQGDAVLQWSCPTFLDYTDVLSTLFVFLLILWLLLRPDITFAVEWALKTNDLSINDHYPPR